MSPSDFGLGIYIAANWPRAQQGSRGMPSEEPKLALQNVCAHALLIISIGGSDGPAAIIKSGGAELHPKTFSEGPVSALRSAT